MSTVKVIINNLVVIYNKVSFRPQFCLQVIITFWTVLFEQF